jgi:hypothetical protein
VADGDFLPAWVVVIAVAWLLGQRRFFYLLSCMFAACFEPCLATDWVGGRWKFFYRIVFTPISLRPGWLGNGDILPPLCLSRPCSSFTARCFLSLATLPRASRCPLSFASFTRVVVVSHADVCMPPLHCILSASCSYCSLLTGPITLAVHALSCLPFLLLGFLCSTSVVSSFIVFLLGKSYWPSWALLFLCSLGRVLPIFTYLVSLGPAAVVSGSFAAR